jgi:outer membrane translocation and assembly module TamA
MSTNDEPLGGEAYSVFNLELRRRLWGRLEGAVFWDVGNVVPQAADFWDFTGYRQGIGLGIRYATPVGPIRVDGAVNPDPQDGEARGAVHFSLGVAF